MSATNKDMIRVVDVTHHYGIRPVLRRVNMAVKEGEVVTVMGPNGMGKSTLLGVIGGVLSPVRGYVEIDGLRRRQTDTQELEIRRRSVYLPDQPWLPDTRTGRDFLLAVGRIYQVEDLRLMEHIDRLLELFELSKQGDSPVSSYSTGQRKKLGLCGALVAETPVLILDEPFSGGLDPSGLLAMRAILKKLAEGSDKTIVMATPVPELVEGLADRIAVVRDGTIVAYDTAEGLRRQTDCGGPLDEVLEKLIHPETTRRIERYFEERDG